MCIRDRASPQQRGTAKKDQRKVQELPDFRPPEACPLKPEHDCHINRASALSLRGLTPSNFDNALSHESTYIPQDQGENGGKVSMTDNLFTQRLCPSYYLLHVYSKGMPKTYRVDEVHNRPHPHDMFRSTL